MPSTIIFRTFGGIQDNRAVLSNSNFVRPFYAGNWNKIRVCCRLSITDGGAGIFPTPNHFALGLCSGYSNIFIDAVTTQFVGMISFIGTGAQKVNVTRAVGPPFTVTPRLFPATKIGANIMGISGDTTVANPYKDSSFYQYDGTGGPKRSLFFVDIGRPGVFTRPTSGLYSIAMFHRTSGSSAVDAAFSDFTTQAIAASPSMVGHTFSNNPASYSNPSAALSIFVDETAHGPLDHVCVASDDLRYNVEISDVGFVRLL